MPDNRTPIFCARLLYPGERQQQHPFQKPPRRKHSSLLVRFGSWLSTYLQTALQEYKPALAVQTNDASERQISIVALYPQNQPHEMHGLIVYKVFEIISKHQRMRELVYRRTGWITVDAYHEEIIAAMDKLKIKPGGKV